MKKYIPFFLLPVLIVFTSRNNPFFWDTIYHSQVAQWFYENGFHGFILPDNLDAGHPPFFAAYLTMLWQILGKNLPVSHMAILPFAIGIYWQLFRFISKFFDEKYQELALLLVAFEPALLTQCTLPSYDLVLVFFYLLGVNSILRKQQWLLLVSLIGLSLISIRGIIACPALLLTDILLEGKAAQRFRLKRFLPYLGGAFTIAWWLFYHYHSKGWALIPPARGRSAHREVTGLAGMFRNFIITVWRLVDMGRLGSWMMVLFCIPVIIRTKLYREPGFRQLLLVCFIPLILFSLAFIPFSNPIGHRYLIIFYLLFIIFAAYIIFTGLNGIKRNLAIAFSVLMLLSGHFWIYPDKIAKGWDSTLAYIPWFSLKDAMTEHIAKENIPYNEIGTGFPNNYSLKETNLGKDTSRFAEKDLAVNKYIFQSNIINDFTDRELDELKSHWSLLREYKKAGVYVRLYKKQ